MNVAQLAEKLNAEICNLADGEREVECGYAGDFLSNVMGKAPAGSAWFTVMNNVNVCAVASLADVAAVVLCENVKPDDNLAERVKTQNVNLLSVPFDVYGAVKRSAEYIP